MHRDRRRIDASDCIWSLVYSTHSNNDCLRRPPPDFRELEIAFVSTQVTDRLHVCIIARTCGLKSPSNLDLAAADDEAATMFSDEACNVVAVFLETFSVVNIEVDDEIGCHRALPDPG